MELILLQFVSPEVTRHVYCNNTWNIWGALLVLKLWHKGMIFSNVSVHSAELWVRVGSIPNDYKSHLFAETLANVIGQPFTIPWLESIKHKSDDSHMVIRINLAYHLIPGIYLKFTLGSPLHITHTPPQNIVMMHRSVDCEALNSMA
ncbi:hypothetical protein RJ640_015136 [Escallonia rubra]|uniref:DUF4283 domain-containing protein n=1 Tax=Escallonia rubra TaxID=112253 RepID=A0AA88U6R4_9ASTE|nr:hypothetical protein RJ640_015136 [Escallonia rubra]